MVPSWTSPELFIVEGQVILISDPSLTRSHKQTHGGERDSEVVTYPTRSNIKREELLVVGELSHMTYARSWRF